MAEQSTLPSMPADMRVGIIHRAGLGEARQCGRLYQIYGLGPAGGLCQRGELARMFRSLHPNPERVGFGMSEEAAQKRVARRVASHQLGPGRRIALRMKIDGGGQIPSSGLPP